MLESILSPSECAECKFCCSFRRGTVWGTPLFDAELLERLKVLSPSAKFVKVDDVTATIDLEGHYLTDNPDEEAPCWFNNGKGCILGEDKPFECASWPLRVMRKDGHLVIALSLGCKVVCSKPIEKVKELAEELSGAMLDYAKKCPAYIKEYREGYPILKVIEGKGV